jgi:Ca-activated chloride channel family protein
MYWENPEILLALWILPVVAWLLVRAERKRRVAAEQFAGPGMVARLSPPRSRVRRWIKGGLLLAGLGLLIAAGARPRFGVYFEKISQRGADVMLLLDVSRSMSAQDVTPSRLERAKSDIRDLLERLVGDRAGLVVFAGRPVVKVPLTSDLGFLQSVLNSVDVGSAPRGGTLIGDGIRKCLEAMPRAPDRDQVVVLITDGEDHDSYPLDAAKQAGERGVKIFTVGLGDSAEGARIPQRDGAGRLAYLKHQGQEVWSKVDENLLKQIALATQGAYVPAGTRVYDLGQIYTDHLANLARSEYHTEKRKLYREQFQLLAALGLALLVVEMLIPAYRRARAAAIVVLGLCTLFSAPAQAAGPQVKVQEGIARYAARDYAGAAKAFDEADTARPDDLRIAFDRGTALAAKGDVDKALELLQKAALAPDVLLAARSRYNLGCLAASKAKARFGEHPENASAEVRKEGMTFVLEAIGHYRDCLRLQPEHADARYNLETLRLWVKHIEALWAERDRQQKRDELDLLQFLVMLHTRQTELRGVVRTLAAEPDSPQRRQAVGETQTAQRQLAEEIKPLQAKIEGLKAAGQGGSPQAKAPPAADEQLTKGIEMLRGVADEAGKAMRTAADLLGAGRFEPTRDAQAEAMTHLDRIYAAVAPLQALLTRSIETQQTVIGRTEPLAESDKPGAKPDKSTETAAERAAELADAMFDQQFVARWAGLLKPKAEQELKTLAELPPVTAAKPSGKGPAKPDDAEAARKTREAMRLAMAKAIALGPKAAAAARKATGLLDELKPREALPAEQEALKLLKEIADALPKEPPKQDPKNDQNKDQRQDQKQSPEQNKDQQKKSGSQPPKPNKSEMSPDQAEAALRQVRQRQQERDRKERQLQNRLYRPQPVDKDW